MPTQTKTKPTTHKAVAKTAKPVAKATKDKAPVAPPQVAVSASDATETTGVDDSTPKKKTAKARAKERAYNSKNAPKFEEASTVGKTLSERAMLIQFSRSRWRTTVADDNITKEAAQRHGAMEGLLSGRKQIIPNENLRAITNIMNRARDEHKKRTLPWSRGYDMLAATGFLEYAKTMRGLQGELEPAVIDAANQLDAWKLQAKSNLGTLYKEEDYPTREELLDMFAITWKRFGIEDPNDFRCKLGDDEIQRAKDEIKEEQERTVNEAMKSLWTRLGQLLTEMIEKVGSYEEDEDGKTIKTFKDTAITNIEKLLDLLPSLNLTGSQELRDIGDQVRAQLCKYNGETLRNSESLREDTVKMAEDIYAHVKGYM